jgi:hypothetical protein
VTGLPGGSNVVRVLLIAACACMALWCLPASAEATLPPGCTPVALDSSFATAPVDGTIGEGEADCYSLTGLAAGDIVDVAFKSIANANWRIENGAGSTICSTKNLATDCCAAVDAAQMVCSYNTFGDCPLSGSGGGYTLVVWEPSSIAASYQLAARRLNDPQGCEPLGAPDVWAFSGPRVDVSIGELGAKCLTFTRGIGEADGAYWFRAIRTAGALNPNLRVIGPSGATECSGASSYERCLLLAPGQYAVVVRDNNGGAGSLFVTAKRVAPVVDCGALPSVAFGAAPVSASISTGGEIDCHAIPDVSSGDQVDVAFAGDGEWRIVDGGGNLVCASSSSSSCPLSGSPSWRVLVSAGDARAFSYTLAVRRLESPQGCSALGAPAAWSFAAPRLNGSIDDSLDARCYTFTRAAGEADGAYWFRAIRSAGTFTPRWRVIGPSGSTECSGTGGFERCPLLAAGQFALIVDDYDGRDTGSFFVTAKRLTSPGGCADMPSIAFGADPASGSIATGGEIDCFALPDVTVGDRVDVRAAASNGMSLRIVDGDGEQICSSSGICTLSGSAGWHLLAYLDASTTLSYDVAVRRLNDPEGCSPLATPGVWSFATPRTIGSLDGVLDSDCYTFTRAFGEDDAAYWFRALRTAGTLNPSWRVLDPSGTVECSGYGSFSRCPLSAYGDLALVVDDEGSSPAGSYALTAKRLTAPTGCTPLAAGPSGLPTVNGSLSVGGEIDCYSLAVSEGDALDFTKSGAASYMTLLDQDGEEPCWSWSSIGQCIFGSQGPFTLLLHDDLGTTTGSYSFGATCANFPCGQSDTAVTDTLPGRVGAGEYTSLLVRGRDLDLLETASLVRGGDVRPGEVQEAAPDGRATEVRFDLSGAATGAWSLQASFSDGTDRVLANAVTVEPVRPAKPAVEMTGRDIFRVGQPNSVTIDVTNTGNVDGIGVPVVLRGIPAGSTVEPVFDVSEPLGTPGSTELTNASFDQEQDTELAEDGIVVPMMVARVPAGRTIHLEYRITVPAPSQHSLNAYAGECWATTFGAAEPVAALGLHAAADGDGDEALNCYGEIQKKSINQEIPGAIPGAACYKLVAGQSVDAVVGAGGGQRYVLPRNLFTWGTASCALEFVPPAKVVKIGRIAFKALSTIGSTKNLATDCYAAVDAAQMEQRAVTSIDPNDIRGPVGSGDQRYISGDDPLSYQVLFENLPAASAPAQRVEITDQLDTDAFDPSTVLFDGVRFGSTTFSLPYPGHEIDDTIDLRPAQNLLVHVEAEVSGGGVVKWVLQALDPDTLAPPDDPLAGFLPPNVSSPEGEGMATFSVDLKNLPAGATVSNAASIVFDSNEPIETPIWTNVIDREPPTASIAAEGTASPQAAEVTWAGTDDAAGIALWEIRVSKDGGPFTLWRTATAAGTEQFVAPVAGTYSFRAVARDGAGNVGQSVQSAVALAPATPPPPVKPSTLKPTVPKGGAKPDTIAPTVKLTKRPKAKLKSKGKKAKAVFAFQASEPGAKFSCKVDRKKAKPCAARLILKLGPGRHSVAVRAVDPAGNAGKWVTVKFSVLKPKGRGARPGP